MEKRVFRPKLWEKKVEIFPKVGIHTAWRKSESEKKWLVEKTIVKEMRESGGV